MGRHDAANSTLPIIACNSKGDVLQHAQYHTGAPITATADHCHTNGSRQPTPSLPSLLFSPSLPSPALTSALISACLSSSLGSRRICARLLSRGKRSPTPLATSPEAKPGRRAAEAGKAVTGTREGERSNRSNPTPSFPPPPPPTLLPAALLDCE